ncbi:MAG: 4-aminobutyrate--2-oxoglutarate transaminase [Ardenticatenaceae bacterium]|nr:4-aminobutyrate--2-oxoglutarate transaminase [Ardenticatenaceae bacterium]
MDTLVKPSQTRSINLVTEIPGPRSRALLARRDAAVPRGLYRSTPVVVARAEGALVHDIDGNTFLDFAGGIGALAVGHTAPEVVAALQRQAADLIHVSALVATYEPYIALAETLNRLVPISGPTRTILANGGAEAVENAVKIARYATGRPGIIVFEGGYHGRSLLTLTMTSKFALFKRGFGPFAPEVYRFPFPNPYRDDDPGGDKAWTAFERGLVAQVMPEHVAAVVIEPVQGEGGFIPLPPPFMQRLRAACDRYGMLLVADEVQTGFARTGRLFAMEHFGVEPDLIVTAKSLAAGMPLSAVTGRAHLMDAPHTGGLGSTYGGNPLACAAALASIAIIERDALVARANHLGTIIAERFNRWYAEFELIGDVRGLGAMRILEIVKDRATKEPSVEEAMEVINRTIARGVMLIRAGLYSNCIRLLIPLVMTEDQLNEGLNVLEQSLREVNALRG